MAKVVIKTQSGQYVGGGREPELVDRITRAYVYEDGPETDRQIAEANARFGCGWFKMDYRQEYDTWIAKNRG